MTTSTAIPNATTTPVWRCWLLAARPATLSAAVIPVLVGTSVAYQSGSVSWPCFVATLWGAMWLQVAANFANDVYDAEKGADGPARLGPLRTVQSGLLSATMMKRGMNLALAAATLGGAFLTWQTGWPIVILGLASIAAAIAYTGGPYPLGYHGLGDVFVMIFFGFVAVMGTTWVQVGGLPAMAWWSATAIGALATAILVVNNVRDAHSDAMAGKRTLVVRWGRGFGQGEYVCLFGLAYSVPLVLTFGHEATSWLLLPWLTAPWAVALAAELFAPVDGHRLNRCLKQTAALLLAFGVLLSLGFLLGS